MSDSTLFGQFGALFGGGKKHASKEDEFEELAKQLKSTLPSSKYGSVASKQINQIQNDDLELNEEDLKDGWGSIGSSSGEEDHKEEIKNLKKDNEPDLFSNKQVIPPNLSKVINQKDIIIIENQKPQQKVVTNNKKQNEKPKNSKDEQQFTKKRSPKIGKELDRIEEESKVDQSIDEQGNEQDKRAIDYNKDYKNKDIKGKNIASQVKKVENNLQVVNELNPIENNSKSKNKIQNEVVKSHPESINQRKESTSKLNSSIEYPKDDYSSLKYLKQMREMENILEIERAEIYENQSKQKNQLQMWSEDLIQREQIIKQDIKERKMLDQKIQLKRGILQGERQLEELLEECERLKEREQELNLSLQQQNIKHQEDLNKQQDQYITLQSTLDHTQNLLTQEKQQRNQDQQIHHQQLQAKNKQEQKMMQKVQNFSAKIKQQLNQYKSELQNIKKATIDQSKNTCQQFNQFSVNAASIYQQYHQSHISSLQTIKQQHSQAISSIQQQHKLLEQEIKNQCEGKIQDSNDKYQKLVIQNQEQATKNKQTQDKLKQANVKIKQLEDQVNQIEVDHSMTQEQINEQQSNILEFQNIISLKEQSIHSFSQKLKEAEQKVLQEKQGNQQIQQQLEEAQLKAKEMTDKFLELESKKKDELKSSRKKLKEEKMLFEKEQQKLRDDEKLLDQERERLATERKANNEQLLEFQKKQQQYEASQVEIQEEQDEIQCQRREIEGLRKEMREEKSQLDAQKALISNEKQQLTLNQQKNEKYKTKLEDEHSERMTQYQDQIKQLDIQKKDMAAQKQAIEQQQKQLLQMEEEQKKLQQQQQQHKHDLNHQDLQVQIQPKQKQQTQLIDNHVQIKQVAAQKQNDDHDNSNIIFQDQINPVRQVSLCASPQLSPLLPHSHHKQTHPQNIGIPQQQIENNILSDWNIPLLQIQQSPKAEQLSEQNKLQDKILEDFSDSSFLNQNKKENEFYHAKIENEKSTAAIYSESKKEVEEVINLNENPFELSDSNQSTSKVHKKDKKPFQEEGNDFFYSLLHSKQTPSTQTSQIVIPIPSSSLSSQVPRKETGIQNKTKATKQLVPDSCFSELLNLPNNQSTSSITATPVVSASNGSEDIFAMFEAPKTKKKATKTGKKTTISKTEKIGDSPSSEKVNEKKIVEDQNQIDSLFKTQVVKLTQEKNTQESKELQKDTLFDNIISHNNNYSNSTNNNNNQEQVSFNLVELSQNKVSPQVQNSPQEEKQAKTQITEQGKGLIFDIVDILNKQEVGEQNVIEEQQQQNKKQEEYIQPPKSSKKQKQDNNTDPFNKFFKKNDEKQTPKKKEKDIFEQLLRKKKSERLQEDHGHQPGWGSDASFDFCLSNKSFNGDEMYKGQNQDYPKEDHIESENVKQIQQNQYSQSQENALAQFKNFNEQQEVQQSEKSQQSQEKQLQQLQLENFQQQELLQQQQQQQQQQESLLKEIQEQEKNKKEHLVVLNAVEINEIEGGINQEYFANEVERQLQNQEEWLKQANYFRTEVSVLPFEKQQEHQERQIESFKKELNQSQSNDLLFPNTDSNSEDEPLFNDPKGRETMIQKRKLNKMKEVFLANLNSPKFQFDFSSNQQNLRQDGRNEDDEIFQGVNGNQQKSNQLKSKQEFNDSEGGKNDSLQLSPPMRNMINNFSSNHQAILDLSGLPASMEIGSHQRVMLDLSGQPTPIDNSIHPHAMLDLSAQASQMETSIQPCQMDLSAQFGRYTPMPGMLDLSGNLPQLGSLYNIQNERGHLSSFHIQNMLDLSGQPARLDLSSVPAGMELSGQSGFMDQQRQTMELSGLLNKEKTSLDHIKEDDNKKNKEFRGLSLFSENHSKINNQEDSENNEDENQGNSNISSLQGKLNSVEFTGTMEIISENEAIEKGEDLYSSKEKQQQQLQQQEKQEQQQQQEEVQQEQKEYQQQEEQQPEQQKQQGDEDQQQKQSSNNQIRSENIEESNDEKEDETQNLVIDQEKQLEIFQDHNLEGEQQEIQDKESNVDAQINRMEEEFKSEDKVKNEQTDETEQIINEKQTEKVIDEQELQQRLEEGDELVGKEQIDNQSQDVWGVDEDVLDTVDIKQTEEFQENNKQKTLDDLKDSEIAKQQQIVIEQRDHFEEEQQNRGKDEENEEGEYPKEEEGANQQEESEDVNLKGEEQQIFEVKDDEISIQKDEKQVEEIEQMIKVDHNEDVLEHEENNSKSIIQRESSQKKVEEEELPQAHHEKQEIQSTESQSEQEVIQKVDLPKEEKEEQKLIQSEDNIEQSLQSEEEKLKAQIDSGKEIEDDLSEKQIHLQERQIIEEGIEQEKVSSENTDEAEKLIQITENEENIENHLQFQKEPDIQELQRIVDQKDSENGYQQLTSEDQESQLAEQEIQVIDKQLLHNNGNGIEENDNYNEPIINDDNQETNMNYNDENKQVEVDHANEVIQQISNDDELTKKNDKQIDEEPNNVSNDNIFKGGWESFSSLDKDVGHTNNNNANNNNDNKEQLEKDNLISTQDQQNIDIKHNPMENSQNNNIDNIIVEGWGSFSSLDKDKEINVDDNNKINSNNQQGTSNIFSDIFSPQNNNQTSELFFNSISQSQEQLQQPVKPKKNNSSFQLIIPNFKEMQQTVQTWEPQQDIDFLLSDEKGEESGTTADKKKAVKKKKKKNTNTNESNDLNPLATPQFPKVNQFFIKQQPKNPFLELTKPVDENNNNDKDDFFSGF